MNAKIISITKPFDPSLTPEEFIVYQARVSSPNNQHNHETGHRLLTYCIKHGHWSVFDMVDVTMEITTSRAIMAQILRHSSFKFQEFSQRYAEIYEFDWSDLEMRDKAEGGNRQGSDGVNELLTHDAMRIARNAGYDYEMMVKCGIAPESARMLLPLATPTKAYMKGSVRSWITYFWQRRTKHAQKEHRLLANAMFEEFAPYFPVISKLIAKGQMVYLEK